MGLGCGCGYPSSDECSTIDQFHQIEETAASRIIQTSVNDVPTEPLYIPLFLGYGYSDTITAVEKIDSYVNLIYDIPVQVTSVGITSVISQQVFFLWVGGGWGLLQRLPHHLGKENFQAHSRHTMLTSIGVSLVTSCG